MYPLATTLSDFHKALDLKTPIAFDTQGNWYERWQITSIALSLFGVQKQQELDIAENFCAYLQQIHVPSNTLRSGFLQESYSLAELQAIVSSIKARLKHYKKEEKEEIAFAKSYKKSIKEEMLKSPGENQKSRLQPAKHLLQKARKNASACCKINKLDMSIYALHYRNTMQSEIEKTVPDKHSVKYFKKTLRLWKERSHKTKKLESNEKEIIHRLCSYPHFVEILKKDKTIKNEFFTFVFKRMYRICPHACDIFIQFPKLHRRLSRSCIDNRLLRLPTQKLELVEQTKEQDDKTILSKSCQMMFHGKVVSIHKPRKRIWFSDDESRTVGEIFKGLKNENLSIPEVDLHHTGFELCLQSKPSFNCTSDRWWENIKELETTTRSEFQEKFSDYQFEKNFSYLVINTSFPHQTDQQDDERHQVQWTHAYLQVYIPISEDVFKVLSIGLYGEFFPKNLILSALYTYRTIKGVLTIPDPCEYRVDRSCMSFPIPCSESKFEKLMNVLGTYLQKVKDGALIYQPQGYNCSSFLQDVLEETFSEIQLPKIFEASLDELSVGFPANLLTSDLMSLPIDFQIKNTMRVAIGVLFGAWIGIEVTENGEPQDKRLIHDEKWQKAIISVPSALLKKKNQLVNLFHAQSDSKEQI